MHHTFPRYVHMTRDEFLTGSKFVGLSVPFTRNHLTLTRRQVQVPCEQSENIERCRVNKMSS